MSTTIYSSVESEKVYFVTYSNVKMFAALWRATSGVAKSI